MIKLRRTVQVLSLLLFVILLSLSIFPLTLPASLVNIYMRMSPLHLLATVLNTWSLTFVTTFIPAIVVVALTLVLGRFFCGWICPMGVTIDATDRLFLGRRKKRNDSIEPVKLKALKYGLLVVVLVAAYFEANLAGWLDPQSIITRTYVQVLLPGAEYASDIVLRGMRPIPVIGAGADFLHSFLKTTLYALEQPHYHAMAAISLIFLSIIMLAYLNHRFWCRFLCPMGALLAITSRFSVVRRVVDKNKCISCNKCVKNCRMGAIAEGGRGGYRGECIGCFTCKDVCPVDAVSFRFPGADADNTRAEKLPVNYTRRALVVSAGAGLAAVPVVRLSQTGSAASLIRPPGAGGASGLDYFMQTCLRCGQCLRVCPTNAIQPVWFQEGMEGLWTPMLAPRTGYCEFNCNLCGQVCPSGAIKLLTEKDKQLTQIGRAVFDHNRCIPWSRAENCLVCEEHCPVGEKAIHFREETLVSDTNADVRVKLPYVIESECIGCGICENKCPVEGARGIRVTGLMPQKMKPEKKQHYATGVEDLLPGAIVGWTASGPADLFDQENLYMFINGGAEIYYEYGFKRAGTREYEKGEDFTTVDVFRMKDAEAAFGILSYERSSGAKSAAVGEESFISSGMLAFRQNEYYVKVNYYGDGDGADVMLAMAKEIMDKAGPAAGAPELLKVLPPEASPEKAVLVSGPLTARQFIGTPEGDPAGFDAGARGVLFGDGDTRTLILVYTSMQPRNEAGEKLNGLEVYDGAFKLEASTGPSRESSSFILLVTRIKTEPEENILGRDEE